MSDVNKPENKNLAEECISDPNHFKVKVRVDNDIAAPVGSFPWAIIQVYLGNKAYRGNWDFPVEYIRTSGESGEPHYIRKRKQDDMNLWQPIPEDLIACDWRLMCPDDSVLSFDLTLGTSTYNGGISQDWGYMSKSGDAAPGESTFGSLSIVQNKTNITNVLMFYREEGNGGFDSLRLKTSSDVANYQNMLNLVQKNLYVAVDGISYKVGMPSPSRGGGDSTLYTYTAYYTSNDAQELGLMLKQVSQTKTFCLSWE